MDEIGTITYFIHDLDQVPQLKCGAGFSKVLLVKVS